MPKEGVQTLVVWLRIKNLTNWRTTAHHSQSPATILSSLALRNESHSRKTPACRAFYLGFRETNMQAQTLVLSRDISDTALAAEPRFWLQLTNGNGRRVRH